MSTTPRSTASTSALSGMTRSAIAYAADDIFLLRRSSWIPTLTGWAANGQEQADQPGFIAMLHGNLADYRYDGASDDNSGQSAEVQRINYDTALNGRIKVYGLSGNDHFYSDDTSAIVSLEGGAGDDMFQIGQIFGTKRDGHGRRHARRRRTGPGTRRVPDADRHDTWLASPGHQRPDGGAGRHRRRQVHRVRQPGRTPARGRRRQRPVRRAGLRTGRGVRHRRQRRRRLQSARCHDARPPGHRRASRASTCRRPPRRR